MDAVALVVDSAMMSIAFCCAVVCDTYSVPVNYDLTEDRRHACALYIKLSLSVRNTEYHV